MGASFWLESCRRRLDLESVPEPTLEDHEEGVEQAMQGVRWVQLS
jgi:hypothetical protein